jgi:hypothetical protein
MCERGWEWHGDQQRLPQPVPPAPATVTVYPPVEPQRLVGPDGQPLPRKVHRFGFQSAMVDG